MIRFKKQYTLLVVLCLFVLLVTLFFGLKPKGYRFINQVECLENGGIAFTNIGMVYSEKQLGAIGIDDSFSISMTILPYRTGRHLSRIAAIIDENGNHLFTIDQWMLGIEVSIWDLKGNRVCKTGKSKVLSAGTFKRVTAGFKHGDLYIATDDSLIARQHVTPTPESGYFRHGRLLLGCAASGQNPWRGEVNQLTVARIHPDLSDTPIPDSNASAATFNFSDISGDTINEQNGLDWNLVVPELFKIFKYQYFEIIPDLNPLKSLLVDIVVNFFGFFPFGGSCFLVLQCFAFTRKNALVTTLGVCFCLSLGIELWQVLIPTRASQFIDVILNSAGGWTGGAGIASLLKKSHIKS